MDSYQQKLSHLKALYHLACSDNELSQLEATYIFNVAERLGVDPEELVDFDGSEPASSCLVDNISCMLCFASDGHHDRQCCQ